MCDDNDIEMGGNRDRVKVRDREVGIDGWRTMEWFGDERGVEIDGNKKEDMK